MLSHGLGHDNIYMYDKADHTINQGPYNKRIHFLGNSAVRTLNIEFQIDTLVSSRPI